MSRLDDQAIALGAMVMCCTLVDELARSGCANETDQRLLIDSLFIFDPPSTRDVYGEVAALRPGLLRLRSLLGSVPDDALRLPLRYAMTVVQLADRLRRDRAMLAVIGERLAALAPADALDLDALCGELATLYQDTLSTMNPRVQVAGESEHLQRRPVAEHIRALLLAAVRAAILWQQLGGRRWRLLLQRRRLLEATDSLLRGSLH